MFLFIPWYPRHQLQFAVQKCPLIALSNSMQKMMCFFMQELKLRGLLNSDDQILVVQSSAASVWGFECPNAIMLYNIP